MFREDFLLVRFVPNRTNHPRFAVIVSKSVYPKASQRVRVKRKMYFLLEKVGLKSNLDVSLAFKGQRDEQKFSEILDKIFKKIENIK